MNRLAVRFVAVAFGFSLYGAVSGQAQSEGMTMQQGLSTETCTQSQAQFLRNARASTVLTTRGNSPRTFRYSVMQCFRQSFQRCGDSCENTRTQAAPLLDYLENAPLAASAADADRQLSEIRALLARVRLSTDRRGVVAASEGQGANGFSQCSMAVGTPPGTDPMLWATDPAYQRAHPQSPQTRLTSAGAIQDAFEQFALSVGATTHEIVRCRQLAHAPVRFTRVTGIPRVLAPAQPASPTSEGRSAGANASAAR